MSRKKKRNAASEKALAALGLKESESTPMPEWGKQIPFDEYLAIQRVSSHSLMDFNKSPRLYKRKRDGLAPQISSEAFSFGTAFHTYVLEGSEAFKRQYHVGGPVNPSTGKPYGDGTKKFKEYKAEIGKEIISENDYAKIVEMHQGMMENRLVATILENGIPEVSILHELKKTTVSTEVKMRLDWWTGEECLDLKTTRSISTFVNDFWEFQYDIQVGMFGCIMRSLTGRVPPFWVLASEKHEPYACKLYEISDETMWDSMEKVASLIWKLEGCVLDDLWPYGTEVLGVI